MKPQPYDSDPNVNQLVVIALLLGAWLALVVGPLCLPFLSFCCFLHGWSVRSRGNT